MAESYQYLYGFIQAEREMVFTCPGIEGEGEVSTIVDDGLAAVVSSVSSSHYTALDRAQAAQHLLAHQRTIEHIMSEFAILPAKFGSVLPDRAHVRHALRQGRALFEDALEGLGGRVQMEILVLWELKSVFEQIGQEPAILSKKRALGGRSADEIKAVQVAVGRLVKESLERRRQATQGTIQANLDRVAEDVISNPLRNDSMVANFALLLEEEDLQTLDEALASLDESFDGELEFRRIGPLPAYSFATVEVDVPEIGAIDAARRRLNLGEKVPIKDIRTGYHMIAKAEHPDHHLGSEEAGQEMTELTEAYQLLMRYAESQALPRDAEDSFICSFAPAEIENTLLISLKRQQPSTA